MKKLYVCLACLLLSVTVMCSAQALDTPYDPGTICHVFPLTVSQQSLMEYLYPHICAFETDISLPAGTPFYDVGVVMRALGRDFPELFHLGDQWSTYYYLSDPDTAVSVSVRYRMDQAAYRSALAELLSAARGMSVSAPDDVQTAEQLHDWICARVTYARFPGDHTAYSALVEGRAACEGYAKSIALLYRMAGIPCGVVTGIGVDENGLTQSHAWNVARVGGTWMLLDATWNDMDAQGLNNHWYYGLSGEQMALDHIPDAGARVPNCPPSDLNWIDRHGVQIASENDLFHAFRLLMKENTPVTARFVYGEDFDAFIRDIGGAMARYNEQASAADDFYGRLSVHQSRTHLTVLMQRFPE